MRHGLDEALAAVARRETEMFEQTRAWVEVNSHTDHVAGVDAMGARLAEAFALPGLAHETWAAEGRGAHHVWRTAAQGARVLLVGHHDTVFPPGHFEGWREEGGRATGPGALDMKGGLAIIRAVLATLADAGVLAELPLAVVSVSDEEIGSPTSRPHLEALARGAACALVFESGRVADAIVTRRRGTGVLRVTSRGRAAHAGNAHREGANAIWALARFIDLAQRLTDYARGVTVNVGTITGGTSKNTVPDEARCVVDLRFESVADANALLAALRAAADEATLGVPNTSLTFDGGVSRLPMERTDASAALYREYAACQRASGLGDGETPLIGGGSDANTVSAVGVPAIDGLGPRGAGFHTQTEYVELASFVPKAQALLRFLWARLDA